MSSFLKLSAASIMLIFTCFAIAEAQETTDQVSQELTRMIDPDLLANSYLQDRNGDGVIIIDAFGDSITRGRGDFIAPNQDIYETTALDVEAGYPLRIEQFLGFNVQNKGVPGDRVVERGVERFAKQIPPSSSDLVVISGGSNDAIFVTSSLDFTNSIQTMINIAFASNKLPVLATIPPTCCNHSGQERFIVEYNSQYTHLAAINDIPIAQVYQGFENTCDVPDCELLNLPEGLHPNSKGYDVQGEAVIAALLKINLLDPAGKAAYEAGLGLQPGSVITLPDAAVPTPAETPTDGSGETVGQI